MTWVLIGVVAWLVVGLALAVLIGRAVRTADRREQGGHPAGEDTEQAHGDEHGSAASSVPRPAGPRMAGPGPRSPLIRH